MTRNIIQAVYSKLTNLTICITAHCIQIANRSIEITLVFFLGFISLLFYLQATLRGLTPHMSYMMQFNIRHTFLSFLYHIDSLLTSILERCFCWELPFHQSKKFLINNGFSKVIPRCKSTICRRLLIL